VDGPATVEVEVTDTGEGIETELLPQIFDLFAQGRRTPDRTQGGLGIGLSLVKTLVHLHGGTVEAASAGRDRGSRFRVRLPVAQPPTSDTTEIVAAAVKPPSGCARPMQLLVVDDNLDAAESLATVLALDGHTVVKAHDAKGAMACARNQHLDAMMLDIGLPGIDGYELARRIRALPEVDGTLLIAVSGYGQLEDRRRAIEAGFDHYLVKPVDFDSLRSILRDSV
jgi:CheY-like chemotaxis protein